MIALPHIPRSLHVTGWSNWFGRIGVSMAAGCALAAMLLVLFKPALVITSIMTFFIVLLVPAVVLASLAYAVLVLSPLAWLVGRFDSRRSADRFLALAAVLPLAVALASTPLRHMGPLSTLLMCCAVSAGQAFAYSLDLRSTLHEET